MSFPIETVAQDFHFAFRQLRRNPGFGVLVVLILALGVGASVAIFAFCDAALIQPLPFFQPDRLFDVEQSTPISAIASLSRPDYEDWKRANTTFKSLDAWGYASYLLRVDGVTERVAATRVSDGFFRTVGFKFILGRDFLRGEDLPGAGRVLILPYATWERRFGSRGDIIGQSVFLSGNAYTIIGVLARESVFAPRGNGEFWVPLLDDDGCAQDRSCHNLNGIGRLRDGVQPAAAQAELKRIATQLAMEYPDSDKERGASLHPIAEMVIGDFRPILLMLLCGAALLQLIACVNVASLFLVRAESRRREIAVRGALGATRSRLLRQFVTEAFLLAIAGCGSGLLIARFLIPLFGRQVPMPMAGGMPFLHTAGINSHTVLFASAVTSLVIVMLAATPALSLAITDMRDGLNDGTRGAGSPFWRRLGANLVIVELTIAVVLLAGAGLLGRSFYKLLHVEMGFDTTRLATLNVHAADRTREQTFALYRAIEQRLSQIPGVQSVGITTQLPVSGNDHNDSIRVVGRPFHGEHNEVDSIRVSPNYLAALKATLLQGRMLTADDNALKPPVVVINQTLARKYFSGEDPIGKMIAEPDLSSVRRIVGVVADIHEGELEEEVWPAEYQAMYQNPAPDTLFSVVIRTSQREDSVLPAVIAGLREVDPNIGAYREQSMGHYIESTVPAALHRFAAWLVGAFAGLALVLGVVGLYGVIAYSVSQRTREIGIRMALGAQRAGVYKLILSQAAALTAIGLVLGLLCSIAFSTLMRNLLFGVESWDVTTLLCVIAVLGIASLAASFIPAHRAACVNPTEALRSE